MEFNIFSCYKCKHATIENSKQVGCDLGHLEKFKNESKAEILNDDYFYSLGKVCLFKDDNVNKINLDIRLGYLFILKDKSDISILEKNIISIKDKNPIWIGVTHEFEDISDNIIDIIKKHVSSKYNVILNYEQSDDIFKPDQHISNYLAGWTLVNIVGQEFKSDAKELLTSFVLQKGGNAAAIVESPDESLVNNLCFFNIIYKFLKGSKLDFSEDEDVGYSKSFLLKVMEKSKHMIKLWSDLA